MTSDKWHQLTQAAPELAAACEEMMQELEYEAELLEGQCDSDDRKSKELFDMVNRAKAALLKAGIEYYKGE